MARSVLTASYYRAIALMVVALFYGGNAYAGGYAPAAFFGLKGIEVVVEDVGDAAQKAGLTQERLETVVALRLRRAGIPILKPPAEQKGMPYLHVRVAALRIEDSMLWAYRVDVELTQSVRLERESPFVKGSPAWVAVAVTGADATMGYAGQRVFVSTVIETVEEFIDKFALAYLHSKDLEKEAEKENERLEEARREARRIEAQKSKAPAPRE